MCSRGNFLASNDHSKLFFYSSLSYAPNPYWVGGNLIWWIKISAPFHHSKPQRHAWQKPSLDGMDMEVSTVMVFNHQYPLWMNLSLVPGHLLMDSWSQIPLLFHCNLQLYQWYNSGGRMHIIISSELHQTLSF